MAWFVVFIVSVGQPNDVAPAKTIPLTAPTRSAPVAEEPKLEAPQKQKLRPAVVDSTLGAPAPVVALPHWLIGAVAGGEFAPSGPLRIGGSFRLMLGYIRPKNVDHLGVSFEPEIGFASNGEPRQQRSSGLLVSLPLVASANLFAGPGLLRVLVGPSVDYYSFGRTSAAPHSYTDKGWALGVEAGASYLFDLHAGLLGLDARFHFVPAYLDGVRDNLYLITIGVSYAFVL